MKIFTLAVLSFLTSQASAQSLLGALESYQKQIKPQQAKSLDPAVKVEQVLKTKSTGQCLEEVQTSLPLAYITALMLEKDGRLNIQHDARSGRLTISSPEMISNCSSMIEWVADSKTVDGKKIYSIEAKIKEGDECSEGVCVYNVAKVEKGEFKSFEKMRIAPNMKGFEQCLEKSGVIKDGKVVADAIYPTAISEKFEGLKETGSLLFLSHGPSSKLVRSKYGSFVEIDECDHYENIVDGGLALQSLEDEQNARIMEEKERIKNCGEYEKIANFIEKYQGYSDDLNAIRDALILDAVKKASKNITEGKYTDEDLKAIADFEKYIVEPKLELAEALYDEAESLPAGSSEQEAKIEEMNSIVNQLGEYLKPPFLSQALVVKFESDGKFDDALRVRSMGEYINKFKKVGLGNNQMSAEAARSEADIAIQVYKRELASKKEKYEIRTGQSEGCYGMPCSNFYANEAARFSRNIQIRTKNFTQAIYEEYARTQQPQGYCYRSPFRNVQKCVQKSFDRINQLHAEMQHFNAQDEKFAAEASAKAKEYAELEKEGRAYVARQSGEEVPLEQPDDNLAPTSIPEGGYTFDFQGSNQMAGNSNISQQPPMGYPQYNQPYMGSSNYNQINMGANFNMGMSQNPYSQYSQPMMYPQNQQNYWSNPYQAMGGYNMYGQYNYYR